MIEHGLEAVFGLDKLPALLSEGAGRSGLIQGLGNAGGERGGVLNGDDPSCFAFADDLGNAAAVAADDRGLTSERLESNLRHAFVTGGGDDEEIQGAEDLWDVFAMPGEVDEIANAVFFRQVLETFDGRAATDDHETDAPSRVAQQTRGIEKDRMTFPRTEDGDHADDGTFARETEVSFGSLRMESLNVDAGR